MKSSFINLVLVLFFCSLSLFQMNNLKKVLTTEKNAKIQNSEEIETITYVCLGYIKKMHTASILSIPHEDSTYKQAENEYEEYKKARVGLERLQSVVKSESFVKRDKFDTYLKELSILIFIQIFTIILLIIQGIFFLTRRKNESN